MTEDLDQSERQMSGRVRWTVIGGSGFVGTGIVNAARRGGTKEVRAVKAPRVLLDPGSSAEDVIEAMDTEPGLATVVQELAASLRGTEVVVNAAGRATPDASASPEMTGANALLPAVIAQAAYEAGVRRLIHLTSAAVQGRRQVLDESAATAPFSAYSESKAVGESALRLWDESPRTPAGHNQRVTEIVMVRATSVQGPGRGTSNGLVKIASSPLSSVASPGTQPSVVSSLAGLSSFVVNVGGHLGDLPRILLQPWEGASVTDVLTLAGDGRKPTVIPAPVARLSTACLYAASKLLPSLTGSVRRLEVMWFGQAQAVGWGLVHGLVPDMNAVNADAERSVTEAQVATGPAATLRTALSAPHVVSLPDAPEGFYS